MEEGCTTTHFSTLRLQVRLARSILSNTLNSYRSAMAALVRRDHNRPVHIAALNVLGTPRDEWALATPTASRGLRHCVLAGIKCPHEVGPMSSQVALCEHHAKDCLQAAEN